MDSQNMVIQSPFSAVGSAKRVWLLTKIGPPWLKVFTVPVALVVAGSCFVAFAMWTFASTLLGAIVVIPWRLLRRGARKRKVEAKRHAELQKAEAKRHKELMDALQTN